MKRQCYTLCVFIACVLILSGCETTRTNRFALPGATTKEQTSDRIIVREASMCVKVDDLDDSLDKATELAKTSGGYVEEKTKSGKVSVELTLRIPSGKFEDVLASLSKLGDVDYQRIGATDITEKYVDTEARLKNLTALRDKLQALLQKAADVKDILAIESELARIQGEIDSMQAKIKAMKGQADFAKIELTLKKGRILGPLGYIFYGLGWGIEKLFIIRE